MTRLLFRFLAALCLISLSLVAASSQALGDSIATHTIAFTSERDGNDEIYLADTTSGLLHNLTHDPARDGFPSWSPDGRLLVYQSILESATTSLEDDMEIHVIDFETRQNRRLFNLQVGMFDPVWAADSRQIVFTSNFELYVADVETGERRNLSNSPAPDRNPAWSPDDQRIAFVSERDGNTEVYLLEVASGALRNLSNHPNDDMNPVWSPDGSQLAFTSFRNGAGDIYVLDLATDELRNITRSPASDFLPIWRLPDTLFHVSLDSTRYGLYRIGSDGSNKQQLAVFGELPESLVVSPDNRYIALHAFALSGSTDIFMASVEGGSLLILAEHPDLDFFPRWSPDSRYLAFTSLRDRNTEIYLLDVQTEALRNLSHSPLDDYNAAWRPQ